jgi:uncharacterized protein (TIRG00374 family)
MAPAMSTRITRTQILKLSLKVVISAGLIAWLLSRTDLGSLAGNLLMFSPAALVLLLALDVFFMLATAAKWKLLLPEHPFARLLTVSLVGRAYYVLLPGQLAAEAMKVYYLGNGREDLDRVAASVAIDKLTSVLALFLLGGLGVLWTRAGVPLAVVVALPLFFGLGAAGLFALRSQRVYHASRHVLGWLRDRGRPLGKVFALLLTFVDAWRAYSMRPRLLALAIAVGGVTQAFGVAVFLVPAWQFGLDIGYWDLAWVIAVVSVVVLIPVSVGGLGVREGSLVGLLGLFGISSDKALSLSLSILLLQIFDAMIGGVVYFTGTHRRW